MLEEAKSEASHALELFEKLGAVEDAEEIRQFLEKIDVSARGTSDKSNDDSKLVETVRPAVRIDFPCSDKVVGSE